MNIHLVRNGPPVDSGKEVPDPFFLQQTFISAAEMQIKHQGSIILTSPLPRARVVAEGLQAVMKLRLPVEDAIWLAADPDTEPVVAGFRHWLELASNQHHDAILVTHDRQIRALLRFMGLPEEEIPHCQFRLVQYEPSRI